MASRASARPTSRPSGRTLVARMIEDVCDRHVVGRDPFRIEALWRDVYARATPCDPTPRWSACSRASRWRCGTSSARRSASRCYELLGGRVRERLRAYTYLYPKPGDATDVYTDPDSAAERAAEYAALGFTALKFDPAGAYAAFDPRQPSLDELDRCERYVGADARGGRPALRPPVRHARAVHGRGRDPAGAAARALRPALVRGADAARDAGGDGAGRPRDLDPDRDRRAADDEARVRPRARGRRRRDPAAEPRSRRRDARGQEDRQAWPSATTRRSRRTSTAGPVVGAANIQLATCTPNFLILEGIGSGAASTPSC